MKLSHLFAFLGGAVAGAAIGLLLAPESGANTRAKIAAKAKEHGIDKDRLSEFVDRVLGKLKENFTDEDLDEAVNETAAEQK